MKGDRIMITIYTLPNCLSCRKAKEWLVNHNIRFVERKLSENPLTLEEVKEMVRMTENGTEDILASRSKGIRELGVEINNITLKEFFQLVSENPSFLRAPIIFDEKRILAGYSEIEIRQFLPRKVRRYYLALAQSGVY